MTVPVYLDYNATTPIAPEVVAAMRPFLEENFGNPSSSHAYGLRAREAVATARRQVAELVGAHPEEICFTGGATEANNLAIQGVVRALPGRRHLVTSAIEHPSVLAPIKTLEAQGWDVTIVPVDPYGRVPVAAVARAVREDTALVSIMHANNETGTLQPVRDIAAVAHARGALMHTDAAQSAGKVILDVHALGVDFLTLAGHKFYAPKGVGALYRAAAAPPLVPILFGAGQEAGMRPGTENVPAIVALGRAAQLAQDGLGVFPADLTVLRDHLYRLLDDQIPGLQLNGHPTERLPNTLNVSFPNIEAAVLLAVVAFDVAASVGSACHDSVTGASATLKAMGLPEERMAGAIRFSVGLHLDKAQIDYAARALVSAWRQLAV
ncbi:cysteine desulfurase NifS [Acidiferrobacter sp. SPIII_3]|jgi:cysteine desulfurase|uniref:cysteine desulfurase family protein n=1 Tax=Acidiferrobacter sp. SPIII_3 TaxID=1281578 RepID=UPI000D72D9C9|nr:cysteine desulfurase family protein [Acidiferrobacter sp. SPIII_3]AWP22955.1 cysteine desulfurase NifS [Acidiferrobacter sp. SPIII_3]